MLSTQNSQALKRTTQPLQFFRCQRISLQPMEETLLGALLLIDFVLTQDRGTLGS